MMRGKKTGGRSKGTPNKATIEKDRIAAEIAARTVADAQVSGKKLAKEVLDEFMHLFAGMAAHHQPLPKGQINADPKRNPDRAEFDKYAMLAVDCARRLAPYQSPTFQAIAIDMTLRTPTEQLSDDELTRIAAPASPLLIAPKRLN